MQTRSSAEIVVVDDVVYKLHRPGTDPRGLATRLRIAAESRSLLSPLDAFPERMGLRRRTRWPRVETVAPQPESVPWADAGRLLAGLHREAIPGRMPAHGWPHRLRRMLSMRQFDVFCLNDTDSGEVDQAKQLQLMAWFLEEYFSVPSPYELSAVDSVPGALTKRAA